jgi:hypothetical protein
MQVRRLRISGRQRTSQVMIVQMLTGIVLFRLDPSQISTVESFQYRKPRHLKYLSKTCRCILRYEVSAQRPCSDPSSSHSIDLSDCDQQMTSSPATHPLTGRLKLRVSAKRCP